MTAKDRWYLRRRPSDAFVASVPELNPILARVLYARGIDTPAKADAFLSDEGQVGNPFGLPDISIAVTRLRRALKERERIVVYGDFDVDGVSATALMVSALCSLGGIAEPYIPDRFAESYGLNTPALERLHQEGAQLVVTVDCGVRSVAEVAHARELGLDIIITDHHSVPETLPPALAVIDPKRPESRYPFTELAGVSVAYRLVDGLHRAMARAGEVSDQVNEPDAYLDLIALGTVADIVPLRGENRLLARRGLRRMRDTDRQGIRALADVAGCALADLDSRAIGFRLGPRLNAAGRLKHGRMAYDLLMSETEEEARRLAADLDLVNSERRRLLEEQIERARKQLGQADGRLVLFVEGPEFHEGVVGLIASRLVEQFYRPALVLRRGPETSRGSARSIQGFHITRALDACSDLLLRYGGHERAAGFSLATEHLAAFQKRLEEYGAQHLTEKLLSRRVDVDAIVPLEQITEDTARAMVLLEPCGEGNPQAALASPGVRLLSLRTVGNEGKHLRMEVGDGSRTIPAIAFYRGQEAGSLRAGEAIDLVYSPVMNTWQGEESLQLFVRAWRPAEGAQGRGTTE